MFGQFEVQVVVVVVAVLALPLALDLAYAAAQNLSAAAAVSRSVADMPPLAADHTFPMLDPSASVAGFHPCI